METMRERIMRGKLFTDMCEGMPEERAAAKLRMKAFNDTGADEMDRRLAIQREMLAEDGGAWIEPPIYFCYGTHMRLGKGVYINVNCNFVDDGMITVGDGTMFGPACCVSTVGHPVCPDMRGYMYAAPVTIGRNCWIAQNVTICPGVTIGDNVVIGAGSVVTRDIPANVVAFGNPCRVRREIGERDRAYYVRDRRIDPDDLAEEAALRDGE